MTNFDNTPTHSHCTFSYATQHFLCCPVYVTLDDSDCLCHIGHELNPSIPIFLTPSSLEDWEQELLGPL